MNTVVRRAGMALTACAVMGVFAVAGSQVASAEVRGQEFTGPNAQRNCENAKALVQVKPGDVVKCERTHIAGGPAIPYDTYQIIVTSAEERKGREDFMNDLARKILSGSGGAPAQ
ncbi:hypothetical protein AB0H76_34100 [Nocardia sp. NPDC050712]|uniref:hypothetical protein n=1 Tax=Nocardia sp. NPDC050712 TaxID=3155518 RepID=UPI0033C8A4F3